MTMKIMKYSGERGAGLGSLVSHTILGSDSADGVEMVPASAVSGVEIDEGARRVRIAVGDEVKSISSRRRTALEATMRKRSVISFTFCAA